MARFTDTDSAFHYARLQWLDGARRLGRIAEDSRRRRVLEDIVEALVEQLERRVGQTFTCLQLVEEYDRSDEWCREVAERIAPDDPWAWSAEVVQGEAFMRYCRRATDYQA